LYYVNPAFIINPTNSSFLYEPTENENNNKKKLIIVHGWNPIDPSSPSYPSDQAVKDRVINLQSHLLISNSFLNDVLLKDYDIYFFTYMTSDSIESNGIRFRSIMNKFFQGKSNLVTIFAHSMGGLVSRIALYQGDSPAYINKIITAGTPFHGSPWASTEFQGNKSVIGDLANFIVNTTGGKDLAWDNFDSSLPGTGNYVLQKYNALSDRDHKIIAYYNSISNTVNVSFPYTGYSGTDYSLLPGCVALGSIYSVSDCIVPKSSAEFSGQALQLKRDTGLFHHIDINLRENSIKTQVLSDLP
jgi:hypothetical protein